MSRPEPVDDDECDSCAGYGYFNEKTEQPTIDKRGRKCLDCAGTGTRFSEKGPCKRLHLRRGRVDKADRKVGKKKAKKR